MMYKIEGTEMATTAADEIKKEYNEFAKDALKDSSLEIKVLDKIKEVYDPEIPVNIWELGLIYDISVTKNNDVAVLMTLTAPNCPEAGGIPISVEEKIKELPEVNEVKAILTFDPAWDMSRMTEEAKFELGML